MKKGLQRLKLVIAYDGTPFRGWQSQRGGGTVQDEIEAALLDTSGHAIRLHGAGRTDTGVHALAQVAHCDVPSPGLPPQKWRDALNARLPPTVRILRSTRVSPRFHARFDARGKIYSYHVWTGDVLPPLHHLRAWHLHGPVDLALTQRAAALLTGRHDFASFAANRGGADQATVRTIRSLRLTRRGSLLRFRVEGDGFLYKMVRLLTGSIIRVAQGKNDLAWIESLLREPGRNKSSHAAPAHGLWLERVLY